MRYKYSEEELSWKKPVHYSPSVQHPQRLTEKRAQVIQFALCAAQARDAVHRNQFLTASMNECAYIRRMKCIIPCFVGT